MKSQSYDTFHYFLLVNNFKPVIILEPGRGGGKACMQTSQCLSYRSLLERKEGLDAFKTSWNKSGRSRMGRRRRRMMMIRRRWREIGGMRRKCRRAWWWSNAPWSLLTLVFYPWSSSFKVFFFTNKKLNNHIIVIHKNPTTWIIWCLLKHQITWHSCLPEQRNHCDQNFSRKSSLSKHMLVVNSGLSSRVW